MEQLKRLLDQYDLSRWVFTRKVLIDDANIPHSHPVLTLKSVGNDDQVLGVFVHEQIH